MKWKYMAEKNVEDIWEEMRWDEKSSDEMRWDEVWGVKCKCEGQSVKREMWRMQCELWSVEFQVRPFEQCITVAQSTHARAWLAHGACKLYRWKMSYSRTLKQLPPRLLRVLLVYIYIIYIYTHQRHIQKKRQRTQVLHDVGKSGQVSDACEDRGGGVMVKGLMTESKHSETVTL